MISHDPFELDGAPLPVLLELFASDDAHERADAACAVGDRLRCREIVTLDPATLEQLVQLLQDPAAPVRFEAAIAIALTHDARATAPLIAALDSRALRLDAIRALGTTCDPDAIAPLTRLMQKWFMPWADRLQAAAALCALGDVSGATYLENRLASRRHAERAAAVHFVGESHHPRARKILEGILADITHPLRDVAARSLGLLGDQGARAALEGARAQADVDLRADIDQALATLGRPAQA